METCKIKRVESKQVKPGKSNEHIENSEVICKHRKRKTVNENIDSKKVK